MKINLQRMNMNVQETKFSFHKVNFIDTNMNVFHPVLKIKNQYIELNFLCIIRVIVREYVWPKKFTIICECGLMYLKKTSIWTFPKQKYYFRASFVICIQWKDVV